MLRIDHVFRTKNDLIVTVFLDEGDKESYGLGERLTDDVGQTFELVGIEHVRFYRLTTHHEVPFGLRLKPIGLALFPSGTLRKADHP